MVVISNGDRSWSDLKWTRSQGACSRRGERERERERKSLKYVLVLARQLSRNGRAQACMLDKRTHMKNAALTSMLASRGPVFVSLMLLLLESLPWYGQSTSAIWQSSTYSLSVVSRLGVNTWELGAHGVHSGASREFVACKALEVLV